MEIPVAVQWLGLSVVTAEGLGSIPGQGTKIPHGHSQKEKEKMMSPLFLSQDKI